MIADFLRRIRSVCIGVVLSILVTTPIASRADTVASLLGNFTINQYSGLQLGADSVKVRYTVVFGQLPALRELHAADADGDGVTSQAERDAYVERLAPAFADLLKLSVDDAPIPLRVTRWTTSLPTEQGGFSLRLDVDYSAVLPPTVAKGNHTLHFANQNYAGRFGWQEIVVDAPPSMNVFATDAFSTSLTADLTEALAAMPTTGPLNERAVQLSFSYGAAPAGAQRLQPRPGTVAASRQAEAVPSPGTLDNAWLQRQTRRLINLISTKEVPAPIVLLALLAAALLGALHAFAPGHGKTIVGAYLIGSRGTPKHAAFLGVTVTITHTVGVFALGFATLFASRFIAPERLFPILGLLSGLLVLGMGIVLLVQRWRPALNVLKQSAGLGRTQASPLRSAMSFRPLADAAPDGAFARSFAVAYVHGAQHHHGHVHVNDSRHSHDGASMHFHGGRMHSHLPPGATGEKATWRGLLALGISGGLVPCPAALVLLLAAIALNKTALGLLLVVAFSVGLAVTLTMVGLAFLYARNRMRGAVAGARWPQLLPALSAGAITLIGALLCYTALASPQF